jgi:EmrB/QacA subfamily drug resistance transporter
MPRPPGLISTRTAIAIAYVASLLLSNMDSNIVNVMLPTIARDFGTSLGSGQWTVVGYVLALAISMPASAWLAGRFGERRVFIAAVALFTVASACCGLAQDLAQLIAVRLVQGAAGGLITPVATAMLYRAYPPEARAKLTRTLLLPIAIGPAVAPSLGGFLVGHLSWRAAFFINIPLGLAVCLLVRLRMPAEPPPDRRPRFDLPGFVLAGAGLSLALLALGEAGGRGWTDPLVLGAAILGLSALAGFVLRERRTPEPLLDLTLLRGRLFRFTNLATFCQSGAFLGGLVYLAPISLQRDHGASPFAAGLIMTAVPVGVVASAQTLGRLYHRIGPRKMIAAGQLALAGILAAVSATIAGGPTWAIVLLLLGAGLTNGSAMFGIQTSMFAQISAADTGSAATIFNVNRQISTAVGVSTATALLTSLSAGGGFAVRVAFLAAAGWAVASAVVATFIDDNAAAGTR